MKKSDDEIERDMCYEELHDLPEPEDDYDDLRYEQVLEKLNREVE